MTIRKKIALLAVPGLLAVSAFTFAFLNAPANKITFDVNPSIELTTNRLDDVIEIKPLNDDAEALLKDYSPSDKDLEDVVNDLVDRMILTGYISGGQDNIVMITVQDNQANQALVDRVNKMIAAFLENKQIEATVVNKTLDLAWDELNKDGISSGKLAVIEELMADDDRLSKEELAEMKVSELVALAKSLELKPSALFDVVLDDDDFGKDDFDLDDDFDLEDDSKLDDDSNDDERNNGIDDRDDDSDDDDDKAVNDDDFEDDDSDDDADMNDDSDDDRNSVSNSSDSVSSASVNVTVSDNVISSDRARAIALNRVNGDIIKLTLDYDDDDRPEYDIEILSGNLKYEIEIDAVTGQILKVESESTLDDDDMDDIDDDGAILNDRDDDDDEDDDEDDDDDDDDDDRDDD